MQMNLATVTGVKNFAAQIGARAIALGDEVQAAVSAHIANDVNEICELFARFAHLHDENDDAELRLCALRHRGLVTKIGAGPSRLTDIGKIFVSNPERVGFDRIARAYLIGNDDV
jgi:hypothetical protein